MNKRRRRAPYLPEFAPDYPDEHMYKSTAIYRNDRTARQIREQQLESQKKTRSMIVNLSKKHPDLLTRQSETPPKRRRLNNSFNSPSQTPRMESVHDSSPSVGERSMSASAVNDEVFEEPVKF
eukprot:UN03960